MKNEPAFPVEANTIDHQTIDYGLSKLEYACIKLGVPKSGNEELDKLINESNLNKFAGQAMQGILETTNPQVGWDRESLLKEAIEHAKELIEQLTKEYK